MKRRFKKIPTNRFIHLFFTTKTNVVVYLLLTNRIHPSKLFVALLSVLVSLLGYPFMLLQQILFHFKTRHITFNDHPPLFIIGHFRSGTTHLHKLMSKDGQFGTPKIFHALFINFCLIGGDWLKRRLAPLLPEQRVQDRVFISINEPEEEEMALFCYTRHNGFTDYFFPRNGSYFNKYVLFEKGSDKEKHLWKKAYLKLLQTISYSLKKRKLLLKNPLNTARTIELNELFPGSKFIFIMRNPYEIFASVLHWYKSLILPLSLQKISERELEERILQRFKSMVKKYLEVKKNLPKDCYVEITFEELQEQPIQVIKKIYRDLSLPGIHNALPEMEEYLEIVKDYKKNYYPSISLRTLKRINDEWGFVFEKWGYSKREV